MNGPEPRGHSTTSCPKPPRRWLLLLSTQKYTKEGYVFLGLPGVHRVAGLTMSKIQVRQQLSLASVNQAERIRIFLSEPGLKQLYGGITVSGHSKWHNIQRRKGKQDSVRGQRFTKLSRDIYLAAKEGGGNPDTNFRLKTAIDRARQSNLPADSITRTIAKATGTLEGRHYEELLYEGYGPAGTAIMMEVVTDNRNRTAADVRHIFAKRGGNLGESGCVAWMFRRIGEITITKTDCSLSFDDLMLLVLDAGADDIKESEDEYVVTTAPEMFAVVRDKLEESGLTLSDAELSYEPQNTVPVEGETLDQVLDLVDALETHDDVQNVYANFEPVEEADES